MGPSITWSPCNRQCGMSSQQRQPNKSEMLPKRAPDQDAAPKQKVGSRRGAPDRFQLLASGKPFLPQLFFHLYRHMACTCASISHAEQNACVQACGATNALAVASVRCFSAGDSGSCATATCSVQRSPRSQRPQQITTMPKPGARSVLVYSQE